MEKSVLLAAPPRERGLLHHRFCLWTDGLPGGQWRRPGDRIDRQSPLVRLATDAWQQGDARPACSPGNLDGRNHPDRQLVDRNQEKRALRGRREARRKKEPRKKRMTRKSNGASALSCISFLSWFDFFEAHLDLP